MYMWVIGGAVIVTIIILPKILELLIGSQQAEYEKSEKDTHKDAEG